MKKTFLMAAACLMLAACVTRTVGPDPMAGVGSSLTVERFLQAANAQDLGGMARMFGTADGPVSDTWSTFGCAFKKIGSWFGMSDACRTYQEVELWMHAISQILRHEDYRIVSESEVPGRVDRTTRIGVDIVRAEGQDVTDVGFLVVREGGDGPWLIQEIELEKITG